MKSCQKILLFFGFMCLISLAHAQMHGKARDTQHTRSHAGEYADIPALSIPIDQPTPDDASQGADQVLVPVVFSSGPSAGGTAGTMPGVAPQQQPGYQAPQPVGSQTPPQPQYQQQASQQGSWQPSQQTPGALQQLPSPSIPPTQTAVQPGALIPLPPTQQASVVGATQQPTGGAGQAMMPNPALNLLRQGAVVTLRSALNNNLLRVDGGVVRATGTDPNSSYCQFTVDKTTSVIGFRQSGQYLVADKNTQAVMMRGSSLNNDAAQWLLKVQGQGGLASVVLQNVASTGVLTVFDPAGTSQWHQGKVWTAATGPSQPASADNIMTAQQLSISLVQSAQKMLPAALSTAPYIQRYPAGTIVFLQMSRGYVQPVYPPAASQVGTEVSARGIGAGGVQMGWWQLLKSVNPSTKALLLGFKSLAVGSLAYGNDLRSDPGTFAVLCDRALFNDPASGGGAQWELVTGGSSVWLRSPTSGSGYLSARDQAALWTSDATGGPASNGATEALQIVPATNQLTTAAAYTAPGLYGSYITWWKLPTAGKGSFTFTVAATADIRIGISDEAKIKDNMYDIALGANGNTGTLIRKSFRGTNGSFQGTDVFAAAVTIPQPGVACTYTLTINKDTKTITITGGSTTLTYTDPSFINGAQYVSLSSEQVALQYTGIKVGN